MTKQDFSRWASQQEREDRRKQERQQREYDWPHGDEAVWEVAWTASSGQRIRIERIDDLEHVGFYVIFIDDREVGMERDIIDLPSSSVPGIVARVGKIGLTAERRDVLKKMMED